MLQHYIFLHIFKKCGILEYYLLGSSLGTMVINFFLGAEFNVKLSNLYDYRPLVEAEVLLSKSTNTCYTMDNTTTYEMLILRSYKSCDSVLQVLKHSTINVF